jgi:soluble lytic murein transglycosylase
MTLKQVFTIWALLVLAITACAPARAAPLSESDRHIYAEAFTAAKRGDWARARHLAGGAHDQLPAQVIRWLQYRQSGSGASFAEITAFLAAHPDWPAQKTLMQRADEAIGTATDSQVLAWFTANPPTLPTARLRLAQIYTNQGRQDDATKLIRQTWIDCDFSTVEEKLMLQRYHDVLRGEDNARRLDRLIWDGQSEQAKRMLRHVGPETAAVGQARLALAAESPGVEGLIARIPQSLQNDPGLLYARMVWRRRNDLDDDAASILEHAPADLGRPNAWASERLILARRLLDDNKTQRA